MGGTAINILPQAFPEHRQAQDPQVSSTSSESLLVWVRQAGVGRGCSFLTPLPSGGGWAHRVEGRPVWIHWKNCLMFLIWVAAVREAGSWEGSDLSPQLGSGTLEAISLVRAPGDPPAVSLGRGEVGRGKRQALGGTKSEPFQAPALEAAGPGSSPALPSQAL